MLTVYSLQLKPYETELLNILADSLPDHWCPAVVLTHGKNKVIESPILRLIGTPAKERIKLTDVDVHNEHGLSVLRYLAKVSRGTLIGFYEASGESVYILNGQEQRTAILEH